MSSDYSITNSILKHNPNKMKKQKEIIYQLEDLKYLFQLFYNINDFDLVDWEKLNKSLNLFYGLKSENNEQWKKEFKDSLKCKGQKTKEGKQKFTDISSDDFNNFEVEEIIKKAFEKKKDIKNKLDIFYQCELKFKSTIIYEAPPYMLSVRENDGTPKNEFVAEFILDDTCSSPYSNAIRGCFENENEKISEILRNNECGFFDVIPIPLPINSDLRNQWATEEKFVIDGKRIFLHFFEWAVINYKLKDKISTNKKHKIALGIPLNNAITLYENYTPIGILEFGEHENQKVLFNDSHSIDFKNKKIGLWIQPFKNCIISTSNTPNAELMKLAFDKISNS